MTWAIGVLPWVYLPASVSPSFELTEHIMHHLKTVVDFRLRQESKNIWTPDHFNDYSGLSKMHIFGCVHATL